MLNLITTAVSVYHGYKLIALTRRQLWGKFHHQFCRRVSYLSVRLSQSHDPKAIHHLSETVCIFQVLSVVLAGENYLLLCVRVHILQSVYPNMEGKVELYDKTSEYSRMLRQCLWKIIISESCKRHTRTVKMKHL